MEQRPIMTDGKPEAVTQYLYRHYPGGKYYVAYDAGYSG